MDPIELIKAKMLKKGIKACQLAELYGDKGTVSKVLHYKQSLSIRMIRLFSKKLDIPVDLLIKEYSLK